MDDYNRLVLSLPYVMVLAVFMNSLPTWIPKKIKNVLLILFGYIVRINIPKELLE